MQDIFKTIFDIAKEELPNKVHTFHNEDAIFYKGFKISLRHDKTYTWEDTRYSNYFEQVDPKITEQVLSRGFTITLGEVMHHNDIDKVLVIKRGVESIDAKIDYWTKKSSELWNKYNKETKTTKANEVDKGKKKILLSNLTSAYNRKKASYQKKRRVLVEEKETIRKDLVFYEARIKMYNN